MTPLGNSCWVTSVTYCIIKKTSCQEGHIILYKKDKKQIKKASLLRNPIYILAFTLAFNNQSPLFSLPRNENMCVTS